MSIKELAEQIGAQPSGLYHHINKLLKVGLVFEAGSRVVSRRREILYATPAPRMRLARALTEDRHPAVIADIVAGLTRQMSRDFRNGAELPEKVAEGEERNLGFFRLVGRPTPAQMARINAALAEIAEILWNSSDVGSPAVCLGWVMAPIDSPK
jgi:DNA-binding transcriptional ArsR family regulator